MNVRAFSKLLAISSLVAGLQAGCSTAPPPSAESDRVRNLERELKRKTSELQVLRERNLVLERRVRDTKQAAETPAAPRGPIPVPFDPSASQARFESVSGSSVPASPAPPPQVASEPEVVSVTPNGEQRFYVKILEAYRAHKMDELEKAMEILLKTYPNSVHADNSLYLAGQLAFEQRDLKKSMVFMDRLISKYPMGDKVVSAFFAKAMIEAKQMRLTEARRLLEKLRLYYPGSPEAARAGFEIKLIDGQSNISARAPTAPPPAAQRREM